MLDLVPGVGLGEDEAQVLVPAVRADGSVCISHRGRAVTAVRGGRAAAFLAEVGQDDPQEVMARWTGQDRRGNERTAKNHPRNAGR